MQGCWLTGPRCVGLRVWEPHVALTIIPCVSKGLRADQL